MKKYLVTSFAALVSAPALSQYYDDDCKYYVRQPTEGLYYSCEDAAHDNNPYASGPYHICTNLPTSKDKDGNITRECSALMQCAMHYSSNMKGNYIYVNVSSSCRNSIKKAITLAYHA